MTYAGHDTRVLRCGLIGENIGNSRLARGLGIMCDAHDLLLAFTPIDTKGDDGFDFDATVDGLQKAGWTGVTVTHPWKTHAARYAGPDMVPGTEGLGASNTLVFERGFSGHNTDYSGFLAAWRAVMDRPPGRVAVAGAGGVARAVVPALIALGASDVVVWDRDADLAVDLAERAGARAVPFEEQDPEIAGADGLVNCTPMGMAPYGGTAFDPGGLGPQSWAFDAVYTPTDTPFLIAARAAGLVTLTGFDLFRYMVMASFEAYTGLRPDAGQTLPKLDALRPE